MKEIRNLEETRAEIDEIDRWLLELFCRRMEMTADVAEYKSAHGMETYRPEREKEIVDRAAALAGPEFGAYAVRFFNGIMSLSREYQDALRNEETE